MTTTTSSANVDAAEIAKFSALASRWWDPTSEFKPLHAINPLRLGWIEEISGPLAGKTVLDVGCGGGILSESMAVKGAEVTGIDLAEKPLAVARLHSLESGVQVNYQCIAVETLAASRPASFDVVTCMEMLEHVPDPASVVRACATLAKPGGHVFFSTLNRNLKSFLQAIVAAEFVLRLLPRGTHDYEHFIKPSELGLACRQAGLIITHASGLTYNPLNDSYHLTPSADVNYMLATVKPT